MARSILLVALLLLAIAVMASSSPAAARPSRDFTPTRKFQLTHLPGYKGGELPSRHFTGHIPVRGGEHQMWYMLVESEYNAVDDPVLLWLTGGPGCSSMDAFVYEHGPFTFEQDFKGGKGGDGDDDDDDDYDIKLTPNPWSWSKAATVVYVDSPVGAGLSYVQGRDQRDDVHTDDQQTTDDLLEFIVELLTRDHPHLLDKEFYVAGESYAGVYVPLLASKIMAHNERASPSERLNLQGYAIGNGVTDDQYDGDGQPEFAYSMGLIDPLTFRHLQTICNNSFWNATRGSACDVSIRQAYDRFYWLNPYDILADCYLSKNHKQGAGRRAVNVTNSSSSSRRQLRTAAVSGMGGHASMRSRAHQQRHLWPLGAALDATSPAAGSQQAGTLSWPLAGVRGAQHQAQPRSSRGRGVGKNWKGLVGHSVPCADRRLALAWLNQEEVRTALHAPPAATLEWQPCSDHVSYTFVSPLSMIPLHKQALEQGLRVLIYSGDHDFVVPFTGTRAWVYNAMNLTAAVPYGPWMVDSQVAGFRATFEEGLTFATVKGAGHMVPQTSPEKALHLLLRFLDDTW